MKSPQGRFASRNIVLATGTARGLEWFAGLNNRCRRLPIESLLRQPACDVEAHATDMPAHVTCPCIAPAASAPPWVTSTGLPALHQRSALGKNASMWLCPPISRVLCAAQKIYSSSHPRRIKVGVELHRNLGFPAYSSSIVIGLGMADHGDTHALVLIHVIAFL
jgi:hypothetical protein